MTTEQKITPALSAEEWASECVSLDNGSYIAIRPDGLAVVDDDYYVGFTAFLERHHAVAALALHKRPFGFTHEDVKFLRACCSLGGCGGEVVCKYCDLADRIQALLPPEQP